MTWNIRAIASQPIEQSKPAIKASDLDTSCARPASQYLLRRSTCSKRLHPPTCRSFAPSLPGARSQSILTTFTLVALPVNEPADQSEDSTSRHQLLSCRHLTRFPTTRQTSLEQRRLTHSISRPRHLQLLTRQRTATQARSASTRTPTHLPSRTAHRSRRSPSPTT